MNALVLRRHLLQVLHEAYPAPLETADVLASLPLALVAPPAVTVTTELKHLLVWGFIENLHGDNTREPWWRITASGVDQVTREAARLDPRLWGKLAV